MLNENTLDAGHLPLFNDADMSRHRMIEYFAVQLIFCKFT